MTKKDINKRLKKALDDKRYEHTIGVAYTASCLAMRYGIDANKAYMAGLLHDCAKGLSDKERIEYCNKNDIVISNVENDNPSLLHAKVGAHMAEHVYEVDDKEITSSIRWHTTGHVDMSLLEEIVFVADYIEPNRNHDPELDKIRKEAFTVLHEATYHIYKNTLEYLKKSTKVLDPTTREAYNFYKDLV